MKRDRAAYMREYRAKRRIVDLTTTSGRVAATFDAVRAEIRIAELEAEVRHLKVELAKRFPSPDVRAENLATIAAAEAGFNSQPFTPVPKVKRRG